MKINHFGFRFLTVTTTLFFLLCGSSFDSAMAGKSEKSKVVLPEGTLHAPQIEQLFTGKTVAASIEGKKQNLVFFFGRDGKLQRVRSGWQKGGTWETRKDGRLCVELEGSRRDCRIIVKAGEQYRQYAVKKDGNHRYELTYTTFLDGEQLAKLSKTPILPKGTLKRKQVIKLFSGQTVESVTARKKRVSQTYYDPNGTLVQLRKGVSRHGKWRVKKDARMCLQMENLEEKCRIIVEENGEIKKYIIKKNGRHQHSVSYRNFSPGKRF